MMLDTPTLTNPADAQRMMQSAFPQATLM